MICVFYEYKKPLVGGRTKQACAYLSTGQMPGMPCDAWTTIRYARPLTTVTYQMQKYNGVLVPTSEGHHLFRNTRELKTHELYLRSLFDEVTHNAQGHTSCNAAFHS